MSLPPPLLSLSLSFEELLWTVDPSEARPNEVTMLLLLLSLPRVLPCERLSNA